MRLFTGLSIAPHVLDRLLTRVDASRLDHLHITTKFIGEWPEADLEMLQQALRRIHCSQFAVSVRGYGAFRQALYAAVEAGPELYALVCATEDACEALGVPREDRPYRPHVTLTRTKGAQPAPPPDEDFGTFDATCFHLYLSQASRYTKLENVPTRMTGLAAVLLAFLIGSIPFGLIVVRLMTGADVRDAGSGNIGATNVLRTAGRAAGVITLLLDIAKGAIAVWLAGLLTQGDATWTVLAALAAMLGHAFSPWLKFQGGKAVATFLGAFSMVAFLPVLAVVIVFVLVVGVTRYLSLGSVIAAGLFPVACWMILHPGWPMLLATVAAAALIIWRHSGNIARIRAGNERQLRLRR